MSEFRLPANAVPVDGRFGCGPSKIRPEQLEHLMANSALLGTSHRQQPVRDLVARVRRGLAELYRLPAGYEVMLGNGGSTAFWDAAAFSLITTNSAHLSFGEFGSKFVTAARAPWLSAPVVAEGAAGTVSHFTGDEIADVFAYPHNETSTGAMAPMVRAGNAGSLTVVDATSAAGGISIDLTETDVYYFAPQKNFASDGGLWFAFVSPAAIERIESIAQSGRYIPEILSLSLALDNSRLDQTLNTPAIATLLLLEAQIMWMNSNGGLDWADQRTRSSSALIYDWAEAHPHATPFVTEPRHRSQVVATIDFDESVDAPAVSALLRANGIVDIDPYRKLGRNQLRIATFTSVEPSDVAALLRAIDAAIAALSRVTSQRSNA
jgi:phosphoserine aminotransferase